MKKIKSIIALLLMICVLFSLSGCHKKGEIALAADGYNITSGMYSYYLLMADSDAKALINSSEDYDTSAKNFNYLKQTIDSKSYTDYVKELAIKKCLEAITFQKLCKENNVTLDDTMIENSNYQAELYWNSYGYSAILEPNGISLETYKKAVLSTMYGDAYFKHLYDEGGEKAISDAEIDKTLTEKYAAVYMISKNYSSDASTNATDLENKFKDYKGRLEKGEAFSKIYNEHNGITEESKEETKEDNDIPKAKDKLINILGAEDTIASFEHFEKVLSMKKDAIEVIHDTENKEIYLIVKKDITEDSYYRDEYLKSDIQYLLKGEEFDKLIEEAAKALQYTTNNHAINQFKVSKIYDGTN
ncbi:MAG: hypothetical protein IKK77_06475 [Clostridia bacterium]|nr:hypothetical protein [Clostridia bacterium]